MTQVVSAARSLREARLARVPRPPFTDTDLALDEDRGYQVQDLDRAERLAAGERLVGAKLGLTSRAKQRTMGVAQPTPGFSPMRCSSAPATTSRCSGGWRSPGSSRRSPSG